MPPRVADLDDGSGFLSALRLGLAAVGLDPARLVPAGSPAGSGGAGIPGEVLEALWAAAEAAGGGPAVAVRVAMAIPGGAWGVMGYLAASSSRVDAALLSVQAHLRFVTGRAALEIDGDVVRLLSATPAAWHMAEFSLAAIAAGFRGGLGRPLPLAEVHLRRPLAPADLAALAAAFGVPVRGAAPEDEMLLAPGAVALPLSSADPLLQRTLREVVDRMALGPAASELELAIRARLRDALSEGDAGLAVMARRLGMSERTLERRLADAGCSYRDIVDAHRRREAYRLLDAGHLSLAEIALHLGYAEQSAFTRSFRRWAGCSPRAYRARRATPAQWPPGTASR